MDGSGEGEPPRSGQARRMGGWSIHGQHPRAAAVGEGEHPASWARAEEGDLVHGGSFLPAGFTTKPFPFTHSLPKAYRKKNNRIFAVAFKCNK